MKIAERPSYSGSILHEPVPVPLRIFRIGTPVVAHRRPGRHGIHAPVNEDAEFGIGEPLRYRPSVEGGPFRRIFLLGTCYMSSEDKQKQQTKHGKKFNAFLHLNYGIRCRPVMAVITNGKQKSHP